MEKNQKSIRSIAKKLFTPVCGVVTPGNEKLFRTIKEILPVKVHQYKSGAKYNGWIIPNSWEVKKAKVYLDGCEVFDGTNHPLGVASYSKSFSGTLNWEKLKKHVHTRPDVPNAYGYHCMWQYRPWDRDWCLCVPHNVFKKWPKNGTFHIDLQTDEKSGFMKVAEYHLAGKSKKTFVINAHTCHPRQANDDIVGIAVAIKLFLELRKNKNFFSYKLILGPEHLGTVFYLSELPEKKRQNIKGGYFLEMPGTEYPLKFTSSFLGDQAVDHALKYAVKNIGAAYSQVSWRCGAGNDETVWEAPGYEIPFVELSRCNKTFSPFREYHTSQDTLENIKWENVKIFENCIKKTLKTLENDKRYKRNFIGLPCLSNPLYNLYLERKDPSVKKKITKEREKWGYLADSLLRYFDEKTSVNEIAERHQVCLKKLTKYLKRFEKLNLIKEIK